MEKVIVIGISSYKFPNEQTGEIMEGAHLHYVSDYAFNEANKKGMFPIKLAIKTDVFLTVASKPFPAICELDFKNVPNGQGKAVPMLVNIGYVESIDLPKAISMGIRKPS